jgi:hypothetical protein
MESKTMQKTHKKSMQKLVPTKINAKTGSIIGSKLVRA